MSKGTTVAPWKVDKAKHAKWTREIFSSVSLCLINLITLCLQHRVKALLDGLELKLAAWLVSSMSLSFLATFLPWVMRTYFVWFGSALWCVTLHSCLAESRWASGKSAKICVLSSACQWQDLIIHVWALPCIVHKSMSLSVVLHVLPYICYQLSHRHQSYCLKLSMDLECHRESKQVWSESKQAGHWSIS